MRTITNKYGNQANDKFMTRTLKQYHQMAVGQKNLCT